MQEFLILLALILGIFFWLFSAKTQNWMLMIISAVFFLFLAVGLFSTGWDRFQGDMTFTVVSGTITTATPNLVNFPATLEANPTIWGFATIMLLLTLALVASSGTQYRFKKEVNVDNKTPKEQYYM